jgi:hypothetical protein
MNLNSLSYRQKNQYLLWGSLAFAIFVYLLAVSKTIALWQENKSLHAQLAQVEQAPSQIRSLQEKLSQFNSQLGIYLVEESDNQEKIVRTANEFCQKNNLILREIPELFIQEEPDFEVITTQIVAQGTFVNLVRLVHYLEKKNKVGRVTSVRFEKAEDAKTRKTYLSVRILLQNIKLIKK